MGGVYGCHMAAYWGSSVLYGLLDAFRPSWALPYKVQENVKIPPKQYAKGECLRRSLSPSPPPPHPLTNHPP